MKFCYSSRSAYGSKYGIMAILRYGNKYRNLWSYYMQRVREHGTLSSNECLDQIPPLRLLGALHKWRCKELERMEDTRETGPAKVSRTTHISTDIS